MTGWPFFVLILYLSLGAAYGTLPSALSSKALCDAALETIVFFKPGSTAIIPHDHVLVENRFVGPALIRVLNRYANENRLPPKLRHLSGDEEKTEAWKRDVRANEKLPRKVADSGPPWRAIKGGTDPVYDVVIGGKRKVFREVDTSLDLRLTIAASIINEAMGIDAVPKTQLVILNGRVGATSEYVDGIGLPQLNQKKPLQRLLEAGSLNPHSYSEAMAFEFIAGNNDAKKN